MSLTPCWLYWTREHQRLWLQSVKDKTKLKKRAGQAMQSFPGRAQKLHFKDTKRKKGKFSSVTESSFYKKLQTSYYCHFLPNNCGSNHRGFTAHSASVPFFLLYKNLFKTAFHQNSFWQCFQCCQLTPVVVKSYLIWKPQWNYSRLRMLWKNNSAPRLQECIKALFFNKYNKRRRIRLTSYRDLSINSSKFSNLLLANLLQVLFVALRINTLMKYGIIIHLAKCWLRGGVGGQFPRNT